MRHAEARRPHYTAGSASSSDDRERPRGGRTPRRTARSPGRVRGLDSGSKEQRRRYQYLEHREEQVASWHDGAWRPCQVGRGLSRRQRPSQHRPTCCRNGIADDSNGYGCDDAGREHDIPSSGRIYALYVLTSTIYVACMDPAFGRVVIQEAKDRCRREVNLGGDRPPLRRAVEDTRGAGTQQEAYSGGKDDTGSADERRTRPTQRTVDIGLLEIRHGSPQQEADLHPEQKRRDHLEHGLARRGDAHTDGAGAEGERRIGDRQHGVKQTPLRRRERRSQARTARNLDMERTEE